MPTNVQERVVWGPLGFRQAALQGPRLESGKMVADRVLVCSAPDPFVYRFPVLTEPSCRFLLIAAGTP